ncbi:hypothetical protein FHG87_015468 [Trinorchestia longiramus]|nr:hypothetical protein FHG87_015468 [Trinorchestia longiramus]
MNTDSLQQHVNEATSRNHILDIVMTTPDLSINRFEVTDIISDHQLIDFTLEVRNPNSRTQHKQVLDYQRANFELIKEELSSNNYEVLMSNKKRGKVHDIQRKDCNCDRTPYPKKANQVNQ